MTDQKPETNSPNARSPGALLRANREQRGVHLAALASAIKVAPARLEALEADDYSGMPDTTFARALAQAVCRALKADPAPVLALMPQSFQTRLERVDEGINAPFRERPGGLGDVSDQALWRHPVAWVVLALLMAAAAFTWWPRGEPAGLAEGMPPGDEPRAEVATPAAVDGPPPSAAKLADAASAPPVQSEAASAAVANLAAAVPALPILAASGLSTSAQATATSASAAPSGAETAELLAVQDTWVQVTDGAGKVLIARTMPAGETMRFSGGWPMKFRIGNVQGTELRYRGQPLDLKGMTSDNTLSLSLPLAGNP